MYFWLVAPQPVPAKDIMCLVCIRQIDARNVLDRSLPYLLFDCDIRFHTFL